MMKMLIHLILLVVVFLIPSLWIIYRPQYFQKLKSSSLLNESITIYRELNGFPHIISSSFSGSLYGLGYVHC
jgi:acyl-homoserine lactone acylase PvdQ